MVKLSSWPWKSLGALLLSVSLLRFRARDHAAQAVKEAEKDWHEGVVATMPRRDSALARIFRDSGWSNWVDTESDGRPKDWCGMAVAAWHARAGLHPDLRRGMWETRNVLAQFTYGREGVRRRYYPMVSEPGAASAVSVEAYHRAHGGPRKWFPGAELRQWTPAKWRDRLRPGDVVLINHRGELGSAHHIAMVHSFEGDTLVRIDGNATGSSPEGRTRRAGVVKVRMNLRDPADVAKIVGVGRFAPADYRPELIYGNA